MDFDTDDYSMDIADLYRDYSEKIQRESERREKGLLDMIPPDVTQPGKLSLEEIAKLCSKVSDWDNTEENKGIFGGGKVSSYKGVIVIEKILNINIELCKKENDYMIQVRTESRDLGSYHSKKSEKIKDAVKSLYDTVEKIFREKRSDPEYFHEAKKRIKEEQDIQREAIVSALREYLHKQ